MTTALSVASRMSLPDYVHDALRYDRHPQARTLAFHRFFGAPIRGADDGGATPTFDYMDDQRVAFRAGFILSEAIELLEKGLGLTVTLQVAGHKDAPAYHANGSDNGELTSAIEAAMGDAGPCRDLEQVVDALGDLNVVVNGFAIELGVNMQVVDAEILASNMTKADNGRPIISDGNDGHPAGKILKGPQFMEPQLMLALGLLEV
jgi:predicted HAD superfamily Cof-like phosphohydrolase